MDFAGIKRQRIRQALFYRACALVSGAGVVLAAWAAFTAATSRMAWYEAACSLALIVVCGFCFLALSLLRAGEVQDTLEEDARRADAMVSASESQETSGPNGDDASEAADCAPADWQEGLWAEQRRR